jgi:hypothetical protein
MRYTLAFLVVTAACGDGAMTAAPCDAPSRAACLVNQHACAMVGGKATCMSCPAGKYAASDGSCADIGGSPMAHDFPMQTTTAGQEVLHLCRSWTVNNPTELWVNAVELSQDEASHHSNWTFVPDDQFNGPDGIWTCTDRGYDQLSAAVAGGVLYAQSTQATHEVQKFPNTAAVRIPPWSRIISDIHLLNATASTITGHAHLVLYTLAVADVKVKLVPFHLDYKGLNIPPHAQSRFTGSCDLASAYQSVASTGYEAKIYYALPHTHAMATRFFLSVVGGPSDGMSLLDVGAYNAEARGRAYDPPFSTSGAMGLAFGCEYNNQRDVAVHWGFGDQEMCELLGFADSALAYEADVNTAMAAGTDGATQLFTGPCAPNAFPWDNNKAGGPGPM